MPQEARIDRIETKLDRLIDLTTEIAQDSIETNAAATQLVEVYQRQANELYDLRRRLGATGDAPDRHKEIAHARAS